jgi:hypothetical protein
MPSFRMSSCVAQSVAERRSSGEENEVFLPNVETGGEGGEKDELGGGIEDDVGNVFDAL